MNMKEKKDIIAESKAQDLFDWWNEKATIQRGDSAGTIFKKIGIRILGVIVLIIFSPILLAVFLMVLAVSL